MKDVHIFSLIAGACFGIWPLLINRSGIDGFASAAVFSLVVLLVVAPVAITTGQLQSMNTTWSLLFIVAAGLCGGLGILFFNTMLAKVSKEEVGITFILMIMIQLAVPAIWHMISSGEYTPKRIIGVLGAFIVAYLLS